MTNPTWPGLILLVVARTVLFTLLGLALWAVAPLALGWTSTTVVTGSMAPAIQAGDIVVSKPIDGARVLPGQVVLANDPDHADRLRLHRMLERNLEGALVLQGDANPNPDSSPVGNTDVRGVGMLRVPWLGLPLVWLRAGGVLPLIATAIGLTLCCILGSGRLQRVPRSAAIAIAAGLAALGVLAVVTLPPSASAAFSARTRTSAGFATAALDYGDVIRGDRPVVFWEGDSSDPALDTSGNNGATRNSGLSTQFGTGRSGRGGAIYTAYPYSAMNLSRWHPGPGPQKFTLELWFRAPIRGQGGRLIGYGVTQAGSTSGLYDRVVYMTSAGKLIFGNEGYGPFRLETPKAYDDGQWHHVVATRDASGMRLIVDGQAMSGPAPSVQSYDGYWRVGYDNLAGWPSAPTSPSFPGWVDDIAIYDRALSISEAQAHYRAGKP